MAMHSFEWYSLLIEREDVAILAIAHLELLTNPIHTFHHRQYRTQYFVVKILLTHMVVLLKILLWKSNVL